MRNYIRQFREERGLSQGDLARLVGTSNQQISHLEIGKRRLTQDWMRRIADALGCQAIDLIDGGPERLEPREQSLVDLFRGLSEPQRDAFYRTAAALAESHADNGDEEPKTKSRTKR